MIAKKPISIENAMSRAAALCAKCEQCSPEIEKKLMAWGVTQNGAQKILSELKRLRFIDDERFVRAYAHDKLHFSGWGKRKIIQGLWAKRLPREVIEVAFDEFDEKEYGLIAFKVLKSKLPSIKEGIGCYEGKMKLLRCGVQRGFEVGLVGNIVKKLAEKMVEDE